MPRPRAFIFAGGGTGGHLFPAIAIAEALQARAPGLVESIFVCSQRPIDRAILTTAGATFEPVPAAPLVLSPGGLWRFCRGWAPSLRRGRAMIRAARDRLGADAVHIVAMGGFVAAPIVQAARAERCPVTLVNLDAVPGKANRWIARYAARTLTSLAVEAGSARRWRQVPPIVRAGAIAECSTREARLRLSLDPEAPVLMVTGGSQGAGSINDLLHALAARRPSALAGWSVLHQTGLDDNSMLSHAYVAAGANPTVVKFVDGIGLWWRAADLAVARAGAGSVAEAWASRVPTLFLPYPWHKDQHQRHNAAALEKAGAAIIAVDHIDPGQNLLGGGKTLTSLLTDPARRETMRSAAERLPAARGAEEVARILLD